MLFERLFPPDPLVRGVIVIIAVLGFWAVAIVI